MIRRFSRIFKSPTRISANAANVRRTSKAIPEELSKRGIELSRRNGVLFDMTVRQPFRGSEYWMRSMAGPPETLGTERSGS